MPGERRLLNVRLTPRTFLLFELTPDHAAIFTKGRRLSGRLLEVNGGETYRIEIRATGYEPHALVVSAADNRIADFAHDNAEALTASQQNWRRGHAQAQADAERWRSNIRHCPTPPASDGSPGVQSLCVSPGNASIRSRAARAWPATSGSTRMALTTRPSTRDSSAHTRCGRSIRFIVEQ